jgi:predicted DNA-binding transcriptional regulator YafY
MKVRYSPRIAQWIAEREEGETANDGSFVVDHPLADHDWAVRHVLQYGPEAEVLEPESVRAAVKVRLSRAAAALKQ